MNNIMLVTENKDHTFKINLSIEGIYKIDIMHHFTLTEVNEFTDELLDMIYKDFGFYYDFDEITNDFHEIDSDLCYDDNDALYITKDEKFFEWETYASKETTLFSYIDDIYEMITIINVLMQLVTY